MFSRSENEFHYLRNDDGGNAQLAQGDHAFDLLTGS
jgi:hypothetical protein